MKKIVGFKLTEKDELFFNDLMHNMSLILNVIFHLHNVYNLEVR